MEWLVAVCKHVAACMVVLGYFYQDETGNFLSESLEHSVIQNAKECTMPRNRLFLLGGLSVATTGIRVLYLQGKR